MPAAQLDRLSHFLFLLAAAERLLGGGETGGGAGALPISCTAGVAIGNLDRTGVAHSSGFGEARLHRTFSDIHRLLQRRANPPFVEEERASLATFNASAKSPRRRSKESGTILIVLKDSSQSPIFPIRGIWYQKNQSDGGPLAVHAAPMLWSKRFASCQARNAAWHTNNVERKYEG